MEQIPVIDLLNASNDKEFVKSLAADGKFYLI